MTPEQINAELARRYRWFCEIGWKEPTLNHPTVIRGLATPQDIDRMILQGMKRWPLGHSSPSPFPPQEAA